MQHFNDLAPDCTVTGQDNRASSIDRHGHSFNFFQIGMSSDNNENCPRFNSRFWSFACCKSPSDPLSDDGHPMLFAKVQVSELLPGQRAACPNAKFRHPHTGSKQMHAFGRWTDAPAGARSQGSTEHMRRGENLSGAYLKHRWPVQRVVSQCVKWAGKTQFAHNERAGGVAVIAGIGDHRAGLFYALQNRRIFGQFAKNHVVTPITQVARQRHVFFKNDERAVHATEFLQQGLDGRPIVVEKYLAGHRRQHVLQADFESFFKVGQYEYRENQENQKLAHELADNDEQGHGWVIPVTVTTVAGGSERFRGPLKTLQKSTWRTFQMLHSEHVKRAEKEYCRRKQGD